MALVVKNRVKETTATTGTGTLTLAGAVTGFQAFSSALSNNDTTYYSLIEPSTGSFEVGIGTFTASGTTLARTTILASSNSNNAINLTAGNAEVFITQPAEKAVFFDASGDVTLIRNPQSALQAATKQYVDTIAAAGLHYHDPVRVQTTGNLDATYSNGSSGVGATLTNAGTQAAISIDGVALSSADRVLVSEQTNAAHNGIYTVTTVGTASSNFVLTRATDADSYGPSDPDAFGQGDAFFIKEGNTNAGHLDVMNTSGAITFGTTNIVFAEVAETTVYSAGNGLTLSGTTFAAGAGTGVTVNTNDIAIGQDVATTASPTFNTVTANLTGNVTGNVTGDVTGNADTATAWETARTISLTGDVTGTATGVDGSGNISITTTYNNDVVLGTDTSGNYIATGAVSGNGLSGSAGAEGATFTVTSNATNSNTASTIVFRDGSGNFSAGTITANLSGVATNATNANSALTAATVTTAAQPNITSLGTLTTLTVDDITINDSTISDSGAFTIDVGGNLNLDTDTGIIILKDGGSEFAALQNASGDLTIGTGDTGVRFNDASDAIYAVSASTGFSRDAAIDLGHSSVRFQDGYFSANVYANALIHDGDSNTYLGFGTDNVELVAGGTQRLLANSSGVTINDITISGSTISDAGDLTLDSGGSITIDADTNGTVSFKDNGNKYLDIYHANDDVYIQSSVNDKDIIFRGNDNNNFITALTLDMSAAGAATFNTSVTTPYLYVGTGSNDGTFYSDQAGRTAFANGEFYIQSSVSAFYNYASATYHGSTSGDAQYFRGNTLTGDSWSLTGAGAASFASVNINGDLNAVDNIYVAGAVIHEGDTNTYMNFGTDTINLYAGGVASFNIYASYVNAYVPYYNYAAYFDEVVQLTGTTPTCNAATSGVFYLTMSGNTTFTFTNTSSGWGVGFILYLTGNGSTVTWPGTVDWAGGSAPDVPANGETDVLVFTTRDGSNWYGIRSIDAAS